MQTLKTAAIVVLLMTVMYGAYVSLTTRTQPLPADVEEMLAASEEESLAIDVGLPASLGEMTLGEPAPLPGSVSSSGLNTDGSLPATATLSDNAQAIGNTMATLGSESGSIGLNPPPVTASLSDARPSLVDDIGPNLGTELGRVTEPISQPGDFASASNAIGIPNPNSVTQQTPRNYPTTNNTFDLPDPNRVSLDSRPPVAGAAIAPELALASGTSEAASNDFQAGPNNPQAYQPSEPILSSQQALPAGQGIRMNSGLSNAMQAADAQYREDKLEQALANLSLFYNSPTISGEERSALLARLDPLAREVIYSKRHLLEQPYRVGQSETLVDVAAKFDVPWQLLANINQISDPMAILPGTELKVVRGPFNAEVNLTNKELTLFLNGLYAGRFPIGIGNDPPPKPGTFTVQDKQVDHTYYNAAGTPVPSGSRDNPYGKVWLDLGGQLCIHGSPSTTNPTDKGCISLAGDFAEDLYGILTQGSSVTIRR